ncbi:M28 family peptidase [Phaeodactylibacter luteus]|nr:M28 family peptidase [Phaeodactylibacter luteus]
MKMKAWILILPFLAGTAVAQGQSEALMKLQVDVVYLASDLLQGRETGKKGERQAADYIAYRFEELGLSPKGYAGEWFQDFEVQYKAHPHAKETEERTARNVIGYLDNGAEHTVVIGAHYDHLGHGIMGSRHTGSPAIHNGADDNASGVAGILRLAELLVEGAAPQNNYLFIAFSGEEMGLFGSKYYVQNPTINLAEVNYMLNLDMVGRLNEEKVLSVNGVGTSPAWKTALDRLSIGGISAVQSESGIGPSDHTSFYLEDIPVLHFFTGQHEDYHKPEDDSELVNYRGLLLTTDYILALIKSLDGQGRLVFAKTQDEQESRRPAAYKVTLGVMPDYVYQGTGMRIDGVMQGRTADKAGLEKGDIILKIGDMDVKDIYGYMEGLSSFSAGDKAIVLIKRGEKTLEKEVTF